MILIKNGNLIDPAGGISGLYDILTDGDRIAMVGACGSLDDVAAEAAIYGADHRLRSGSGTGGLPRALQGPGIYL